MPLARYLIDPARSRVWIDARSNLHPIHSEAGGLTGWLELGVDDGKVNLDEPPGGHLEFPVENLKSGNALEDRELLRRIDSRRYPTIAGDLKEIRSNNDDSNLVVNGDLTFRGVTRWYEDEMTFDAIDGDAVRMVGESTFDIRDFGMEPPRILMLKVHPDVRIRVELVAERQS